MTAPEPFLTSTECCSECKVPALAAGGGDLKVCPRCYAVLWHRDYTEEARRFRAAQRAAAIAYERQAQIARDAIIDDRIRMLIECEADAEG
jgi:hypothetical protein